MRPVGDDFRTPSLPAFRGGISQHHFRPWTSSSRKRCARLPPQPLVQDDEPHLGHPPRAAQLNVWKNLKEAVKILCVDGMLYHLPSHQLTWKCKKALSKKKVGFLQGSVHFHVSWWEGVRDAGRMIPQRKYQQTGHLDFNAPANDFSFCQ